MYVCMKSYFSELKVVMLIESSYYQFLFKYYAKCNILLKTPLYYIYTDDHTT